MESWLADRYLAAPFWVPGAIMQPLLNWYLETATRVQLLLHRTAEDLPSTEEIAALSDELMDAHYDQPRELFEHFLGRIMKYSMGLWESGARTLEESQQQMMDDVCTKAQLQEGQHVLDIGCGFGAFAAHVLQHYPQARVTGLSLSKVQCDYMREMQNTPGHVLHTDRFRLIEGDFNTVQLNERFDRVVSIGVFEHVSNLARGLEAVRGLMTEEALCFLHYIVYRRPMHRIPPRPPESNFIHRYIFPGGRVWFDEELYKHDQDLKISDYWFLNGVNYRRTLEAWLVNFHANLPALRKTGKVEERVLKVWDLYLRICVAVFSSGGGRWYGNGQYLLRPA